MFKKLSFLLVSLLVMTSCSDQYYKNKKNPTKITYRGQRTISSEIEKKTKEIINKKLSTYENPEEDYHEIPPAVQVTTAVTEKYIESYKEISMVEMQRYKIPASITLAQAILESGSGQGRLARHGNNHFGIKCHSAWKGKTMTHDDDEKGECFRRYKYAYESFEDHSAFLVNRSRYASLFQLAQDDYEGWAHGLKKAGYATDPEYAKKLIFLIKKYKLYQYDEMVLKSKSTDNQQVASKKETSIKEEKNAIKTTDNQPVTAEKQIPNKEEKNTIKTTENQQVTVVKQITIKEEKNINTVTVTTENTIEKAVESTVDSIIKTTTKTETITQNEESKKVVTNPLPTYYMVKSGDTLYKISREQKVPLEQLIKLNNLNEKTSNSLYIGQELRLN